MPSQPTSLIRFLRSMDGHEAGDVVRMERARARHYTSYNFAELVVEEELVIESARMPEPENAALRIEKAAPAKPRAKKKKKKKPTGDGG